MSRIYRLVRILLTNNTTAPPQLEYFSFTCPNTAPPNDAPNTTPFPQDQK